MTDESVAAIQAVEEAEEMFEAGNSLAAIRRRILEKPLAATSLAYVEGYIACMARRMNV